jgi:hypothetical protein
MYQFFKYFDNKFANIVMRALFIYIGYFLATHVDTFYHYIKS